MHTPFSLNLLQILTCVTLPTLAAAQSQWKHSVPPPPAFDGRDPFAAMEKASARAHANAGASFTLDRARPLCVDRDEHGAVWVRGHTYKASFDAHGATYIPFFGSRAPRNFPVHFQLVEATSGGQPIELSAPFSAIHTAGSVKLDHGPIDEVYELGLESIEQTFVLEKRPPAGELRLSIAVETELVAAEGDAGFEFGNELGHVRYGRASIRERDGSLTSLETLYLDGRIEIRIPSTRMEAAEFPLVIDPVVSTFPLDLSPFDAQYPDVAYDVTSDRSLVTFLEIYSATDFDLYSQLVNNVGTIVSAGYVDMTAEIWFLPSVANMNNADKFLVVSTTGDIASATNRRIKGRITGASAISYGPVIDISGTATDYNLYPEVGGDSYPVVGTAFFCVGWQRTVGGLQQVVYRLVDGNGVPQGADATLLQSSPGVKDVAVSKDNNGARWNIAFDRCPSSASDCDIFAARVGWTGTLETPAFAVSNVALVNYAPHVTASNAAGQFLIAWTKDNGLTDRNVECALMTGGVVSMRADMTALEAAEPNENQFVSTAELSNDQFYVGYSETYNGSGTDTDPYVSSVVPIGSGLALAERHEDLAYTSSREDHVALCAEQSGGTTSSRLIAVWRDDDFSSGQSNIRGAFVDAPVGGARVPICFGDGTGTACPCANSGSTGRGCANSLFVSGALLVANGAASVSLDSLVFTASGTAGGPGLFFQGGTSISGTPFGDGLLCTGGALSRLAVKFPVGGVLTYPTGADLDVSVAGLVPATGAVRIYQTWYRDAATFCTASTFNLTNAMRVTWLP